MSDKGPSKKLFYIVFASLAVNIFMAGFIVARLPLGFMPPPPPFGMGKMMLPPPGGMAPPFMAGALFTPDEMEADRPLMDKNFQAMRSLRKEFAEQLKQNALTPEMMKDHFTRTNAIMDEMRGHLQQKMIDKVTSMSPQERKDFADELAGGK